MEETPKVQEDLGGGGKFKNWLSDNIRIILSVLIVIVIAAGIYSYSKRSEEATIGEVAPQEIAVVHEEEAVTIIGEEQIEEVKEEEEEELKQEVQQKAEEKKEEVKENAEDVVAEAKKKAEEVAAEAKKKAEEVAAEAKRKAEEVDKEQLKEDIKEGARETVDKVTEKIEEVRTPDGGESQVATSQETGEAFVETAGPGDSYTVLARRALTNHLEKNNDSELTAEHKIFIEDYLRRQVQSGSLNPGDQVTFSKTQIRDAIEMSKTLTPAQLKNLEKYSAQVPGI